MSRTYRTDVYGERIRDGQWHGNYGKSPSEWNRLYHNAPKRRKNKRLCKKILDGYYDCDNISWPLGNSKPHVYYW